MTCHLLGGEVPGSLPLLSLEGSLGTSARLLSQEANAKNQSSPVAWHHGPTQSWQASVVRPWDLGSQTLNWVFWGLRNRAPIFFFHVTSGGFPALSFADVAGPLGETTSDQSVVWFGITQGPNLE